MKQTTLALILYAISIGMIQSQNVGVGTQDPTAKLHIKGNTTEILEVQDGFEDNLLDPPYNIGGIGSEQDGPGNWFISTNAYTGTLGLQVPPSTSEGQYEVFTYFVTIPAGRTVTITGRKRHPTLSFSEIAVAVGSEVQFLPTSNFLNVWQPFSVTFETTQEESFVYFGYKSNFGGTTGLQLFFDDIHITYEDFTGESAFQIQDGSEGESRLLVSDENGKATWKEQDSLRINRLITGTDTLQIRGDGSGSVSWGKNNSVSNAQGMYTTGWGDNNMASGYVSTVWGDQNTSSSYGTTVWGGKNSASNIYATSFGYFNVSSGYASNSWGTFNEASGSGSTVWGISTVARSSLETALGRYNESPTFGDPDDWQEFDYLFSIGNGTSDTNRRNALTVLKNGNIGLTGVGLPIYRFELPNSSIANEGKARAISWDTYSDSRIKSNQKLLKYGLQEILQLTPKSYYQHSSNLKNNILTIEEEKTPTIGLIAQEVYDIIPEAVNKPEDENKDLWSMDYEKLIPVLIKSIQELNEKVENLKQENFKLVKLASTNSKN